MSTAEPTYQLDDIIGRGQLSKLGRHLDLNDYQPLESSDIADASLELVTCYIGLHHISLNNIEPFIQSIVRLIKPGGYFVLRDHDCTCDDMKRVCSLIHTVFNIGTGEDLSFNANEFRHFQPFSYWVNLLSQFGLTLSGELLLQDNDPTNNTLALFIKEET